MSRIKWCNKWDVQVTTPCSLCNCDNWENESKQWESIMTATNQEIMSINVVDRESCEEFYKVGRNDITRIEAYTEDGQMASVPYLRVWKGDKVWGEFCKHNIIGVYYK